MNAERPKMHRTAERRDENERGAFERRHTAERCDEMKAAAKPALSEAEGMAAVRSHAASRRKVDAGASDASPPRRSVGAS